VPQVVVRDAVHVLARPGHFAIGVGEPLFYDSLRVCAAPLQSGAELLHRGRRDEDVDVADLHGVGVGQGADVVPHLCCALDVYVEDHRVAFGQDFRYRRLESAVVVVVDLGVLDEGVFGNELLEALFCQEVVVQTVLLLAPGGSGGAGDGVYDVVVLLKEHVDQR